MVRDYVALKPAGGGSLKGLCRFHDERSPSFHVTPSRGMYYCFGCQEGGDVITFVQKVDHLTFAESVGEARGAHRGDAAVRRRRCGREPPAGAAHPAHRGEQADGRVLRAATQRP
ncbi:MAG: CHC2 zinc finger domain-containing protein [bacterium]